MFVLDTNVISELRSGKPRQPANSLYLSAVTVLALDMCVLRLARKVAAQANTLRGWVDAALVCAPRHGPGPRRVRNSIIAATAMQHGSTLVTRNVDDFKRMALKIVNPWNA